MRILPPAVRTALDKPSTWIYIHGSLVIVWAVLIGPAIIWWRDSVAFVVLCSVYANVAGSAASWQSARADCNSPSSADLRRIEQGQATHVAAVLALQRKVDMLIKRVG